MRPVFRRISLRPQPRRGQSLVIFAFVLIATLALAALLIDIGIVQLTRRQMQTAVNTAALEGLRFRDSIPVSVLHQLVDCGTCDSGSKFFEHVRDKDEDCNCPAPANLSTDSDEYYDNVKDYLRRKLAARAVYTAFDDDLLSPTVGRPDRFGAGPLSPYGPGIPLDGTTFEANRLIEPGRFGRYVPDQLQRNRDNDPAGDFVAGNFTGDEKDENGDLAAPWEADTYHRTDFVPVVEPEQGNAFLARLRRTGEDFSAMPQVGSAGPPVPFFFGRGAVVGEAPPFFFPRGEPVDMTLMMDRRERGTNVRATAIAVERPANTIGEAFPANATTGAVAIPGLAPFAVAAESWKGTQVTYELGAYSSLNCPSMMDQAFLIRIAIIKDAITAVDTQLTVSAMRGFPDSPPYRVRIGDEIVRVIAATAAGMDITWTIERGVSGTTPAAHSANDLVMLQQSMSVGTRLAKLADAGTGTAIMPNITENGDSHALYVPIFRKIDGNNCSERVIGFGLAESWSITSGNVTVVRSSQQLTPRNATVSIIGSIASPIPAIDDDLFDAQKALAEGLSYPNVVLAPAFARSVPVRQP